MNQDSVIRCLEVIGEAVKYLPDEFKQKHGEVAWNKAASMRNKLIHEYFGVELDLVWDTVMKILPPFKEQIKKLI